MKNTRDPSTSVIMIGIKMAREKPNEYFDTKVDDRRGVRRVFV